MMRKLSKRTATAKQKCIIVQGQRKPNSACILNSPYAPILFFQKNLGNKTVESLLKSGFIQSKLKKGHPGNRFENEAGRVTCIPEIKLQQQTEERNTNPSTTMQRKVSVSGNDWRHLSGFEFELTAKGRKKADFAVTNLFKRQRKKKDRTLIDCTHMIVALRYYALMKSLGRKVFRQLVKTGKIQVKIISPWKPPVLQSLQYQLPWVPLPLMVPLGTGILTEYWPTKKSDLIPGDHVYFNNHKTYPYLLAKLAGLQKTTCTSASGPCCPKPSSREKRRCQDIWRGEHAIYLGKRGGERIFQGHGTSKLTENEMQAKLLHHYNCHVDQAMKCHPPLTNIGGYIIKKLKDVPGLYDPLVPNRLWKVRRPVFK
jgi:hypothetical protein